MGVVSTLHHFSLKLNPDHPVYLGHFPGSPVVPGVCQVMMIQELMHLLYIHKLRMEHVDMVKFLNLIVPGENTFLEFDISCRETEIRKISANAKIQAGDTVFLKFKGTFSRL